MKNPDETISKLKEFSRKIHNGYFRINFLIGDGYYMFIEDLLEVAKKLVIACEYQLSRLNKPLDDSISVEQLDHNQLNKSS